MRLSAVGITVGPFVLLGDCSGCGCAPLTCQYQHQYQYQSMGQTHLRHKASEPIYRSLAISRDKPGAAQLLLPVLPVLNFTA